MAGWLDPVVEEREELAILKLQHVTGGLYMWEFLTHISFDWKLATRPTKSRSSWWARGAYLSARILLVATFIDIFVGLDAGHKIHCMVQNTLLYALPALAAQSATVLIATRVIAIWDCRPSLVLVSVVGLLAQLSFVVYTLTKVTAVWDPEDDTCMVVATQVAAPISTALLSVDLCLLGLMIVGLLRRRDARHFSLWRVLWGQGWLWLTVATLSGVPPVVFLYLNLNPFMNVMFLTPQLLISVVGATRLYRSLANFTHGKDNESFLFSKSVPSIIRPTIAIGRAQTPVIEITVERTYLQRVDVKSVLFTTRIPPGSSWSGSLDDM
ncbi:unnamed protein product [Peniophora sp. CBMAI 1063]|nr:unnamed protein product [Peniophora sp. CBMAI 1063]